MASATCRTAQAEGEVPEGARRVAALAFGRDGRKRQGRRGTDLSRTSVGRA